MVSGADVRVALEAGLWKALVGSGDHASMRCSCKDARAMADMLHDTAVLPVGPDTLGRAASIAAHHRRLGTVRALHVRYSAEDDEAHAVQFMEDYSAALGTDLSASHCSMSACRQLPSRFAALLLQRVVPGVERVDMALGSYGNLEQLLQALEPCTRLDALRILPLSMHHWSTANKATPDEPFIGFCQQPGVLDALCRLTHLHTLSGPWRVEYAQLKRLCDALPSLATLGFHHLFLLDSTCACISRQLHTLAACYVDERLCGSIFGISAMLTALPAVQQLKGVGMFSGNLSIQADMLVALDAVQRFAACTHEWTLRVWPTCSAQCMAQGLPAGCMAPLRNLDFGTPIVDYSAGDVAAMLGCLVSAAPNLATLKLYVTRAGWRLDLAAMVLPLRQAPHLHTLRLDAHANSSSDQQAAALEGVVRCLAQPGAGGEGAPCRALQRVLLSGAGLDALVACRRALARDGIDVCVDAYAA